MARPAFAFFGAPLLQFLLLGGSSTYFRPHWTGASWQYELMNYSPLYLLPLFLCSLLWVSLESGTCISDASNPLQPLSVQGFIPIPYLC